MKLLVNIVGVILTLSGILWILQGMNVLRGGVMGGQIQWAVIGLVVGIVGIGLLVYVNRRPVIASRTPH